MIKQPIIILNPESHKADNARYYFSTKNAELVISENREDLGKLVENLFSEGVRDFYLCGGDGFVNNFINTIMLMPVGKRNLLNTGIIPCGRANDLARELGLADDFKTAYEMIISSNNSQQIDLICVNGKYYATGGGIGIPAETIKLLKNFQNSKVGSYVSKQMGQSIYTLIAAGLIIKGYCGVLEYTINDYTRFGAIMIAVQNQAKIGKYLNISPDAKNNDGKFDVCIIKSPKSPIEGIRALFDVCNARHVDASYTISFKCSNLNIRTYENQTFMGDGELLTNGNLFDLTVEKKVFRVKH